MTAPISPSELLMTYLKAQVDPLIVDPANIVVGPANRAQQEAGVVELVDAGMPRLETFPGVVWVRSQVRILHTTLARVDTIGRHVYDFLVNRNRIEVVQPSTGSRYLIHAITLAAGPSKHWDTPVTYEELMFAELMVGTEAVA